MIFHAQDQLMAHHLMCQHCQALRNECYGLANKVCSHCQHNKKMCQDVVVEGESPSP